MNSSRFRKFGACAALAVAILTPVAVSQADAPLPNPPEFPDENQLLPDQDLLGKFLFWDEQLSHDNTMSCGTCHIHEAGGSDPRSDVATVFVHQAQLDSFERVAVGAVAFLCSVVP